MSDLLVSREGAVVVATINRERRRNALDDATLEALRDVLHQSAREEVAAIVLAGAGLQAFSAGSDIKEMAAQTYEQKVAHTDLGQAIGDLIEQHPALVIAAIEGYCLGGGLELAAACDLRIAGADATFALPEVALGALPSWGGMTRLPRLIGAGRARELILFGRQLNAREALDWGLVGQVVAAGQAVDRARAVALDVAARTDRSIVAIAKSVVTHGLTAPARTARHLELLADRSVLASAALAAGVSRFVDKPKGSSA